MSNVLLRRAIRGVLLTLVVLFFLFPMFWVLLMSFQTNRDILRTPPSLFFTPTISNYVALISGEIQTSVGTLPVDYMKNLWKIAIPLARPGIAAAGLLAFIFAWNSFVFALVLGSSDVQPVTVGSLAFMTASGIQYGTIAAALVLSIIPTLLLALYTQRYLVEGLSLGAVKG